MKPLEEWWTGEEAIRYVMDLLKCDRRQALKVLKQFEAAHPDQVKPFKVQ